MKYIEFTDKQIKSNNLRTMKKGLFSNLSKEQLNELISKYFRDENGNLHCAYSGEIIKNKKDLALEHIIPVTRNGSSVIFNVCTTTKKINSSKRNNDPLTWWKEQSFYDIDRLRNLTMYILEAYDVFFNEHETVINDEYVTENIKKLETEEYEKAKRIQEEELEQIDYSSLLNSLVYELSKNDITLENIDKDNKYGVDYKKIYDGIIFNNYFKDCEEKELYQRIILKYLDIYAKERKYIIATNINYKEIYQGINKILEEENVKEEDRVVRIDYLIHNRITFLRNKIAIKLKSDDKTILETIIDMPGLLYKPEEEFTEEYIKEIKENSPINKYIRFQYLTDFYRKKGRWPKKSEKYKGENIGQFLGSIKHGYTSITEEQRNQLLELDPNIFENFHKIKKENNIAQLADFYKNNGRWPRCLRKSRTLEEEEEKKLGTFLQTIKTEKTSITEEQRNQLLELDPNIFEDSRKIRTENNVAQLIEFYHKNKRRPLRIKKPKTLEEEQEKEIARILDRIKNGKTTITESQKNQLLALDPNIFENPQKVEVDRKFSLLLEFYDEHGRWPRQITNPKTLEEQQELKLGKFLNGIKTGNVAINEDQKDQLLALDPKIFENQQKIGVNCKFSLLLEFYGEYRRWPKGKEQYKGVNLGSFYTNVKQSIKSDRAIISKEQQQQLLELDLTALDTKDLEKVKRDKFLLLIEFYKKNYRWPRPGGEEYKGENIGSFYNDIKRDKLRITEQQQQQLLALDPYVFESESNKKFNLLLEYATMKKSQNKEKIWPKVSGEKYKEVDIGTFLMSIKRGTVNIAEEQKQQLLELDPTLVIKEKAKRVANVKNLKDIQENSIENKTSVRRTA